MALQHRSMVNPYLWYNCYAKNKDFTYIGLRCKFLVTPSQYHLYHTLIPTLLKYTNNMLSYIHKAQRCIGTQAKQHVTIKGTVYQATHLAFISCKI